MAWNLTFTGWTVRNWMFNDWFCGFVTFSSFWLEAAKGKKKKKIRSQKLSLRNVPFQLHNCFSSLVSFPVRFSSLALTSPIWKLQWKKHQVEMWIGNGEHCKPGQFHKVDLVFLGNISRTKEKEIYLKKRTKRQN